MPEEQRPGLVIVYTGDGKGKTTAALGAMLRAWGRGLRVAMYCFIKGPDFEVGERLAAGKLAIEIVALGRGFVRDPRDAPVDRELAQRGWLLCREKLLEGAYDVLVLDEITYPINFGWLDVAEVIDVLRRRRAGLHVILTGRDAPPALIDFADLVTEMREAKHPYSRGIEAQPGIDF